MKRSIEHLAVEPEEGGEDGKDKSSSCASVESSVFPALPFQHHETRRRAPRRRRGGGQNRDHTTTTAAATTTTAANRGECCPPRRSSSSFSSPQYDGGCAFTATPNIDVNHHIPSAASSLQYPHPHDCGSKKNYDQSSSASVIGINPFDPVPFRPAPRHSSSSQQASRNSSNSSNTSVVSTSSAEDCQHETFVPTEELIKMQNDPDFSQCFDLPLFRNEGSCAAGTSSPAAATATATVAASAAYDGNNMKNGEDQILAIKMPSRHEPREEEQGNDQACCNFLAFPRNNHGGQEKNDGASPFSASARKPTGYDVANLQIAEQLNKLSQDERSQVLDEIHCVADGVPETPQLIAASLGRFRNKLKKTRSSKRKEYDIAAFMNPNYIKSDEYQLMFLRATMFDVQKAVNLIISHLKEKMKLFGPDLVGKRLTFANLDEETQSSVLQTEGPFMYSSCKDRSGRAFFCQRFIHEVNKGRVARRQTKAIWYMVMSCLEEDETTQRLGVNITSCTLGTSPPQFLSFFELQKRNSGVLNALPMRVSANHLCVEDPKIQQLCHLVTSLYPCNTLVRTKVHCGSHLEIAYSLQSYGVDRQVFPLDDQGKIVHSYIQQWIEDLKRREKEREEAELELLPAGAIICPKYHDVILGRGNSFQRHEGNVRLIRLIEARSRQHDRADRFQKQVICQMLLGELKSSGHRFLERHPESPCWIVASSAKAHEKVAQGFRNSRRRGGGGGNDDDSSDDGGLSLGQMVASPEYSSATMALLEEHENKGLEPAQDNEEEEDPRSPNGQIHIEEV